MRLFDVQGTIELTYDGSGTLIVIGYEGEPYLRIGPDGVEQNVNSPATYLNQDRYARTPLPATADAEATPDWQQISSGRTVSFHDHRTHWMSTVPPTQVEADPDQEFVIFEHWEIPLTIDGRDAVLAGDLTWVPAPSRVPWIALGLLVAAAAAVVLVRGAWQRAALPIAAIGTALFVVDTVGYWRASKVETMQGFWLIGWPLLAVVATVALFVVRKRPAQTPSAFIALSALVLAAVAGYDRIDVVTNSQIQSSNPDWLTRTSAVACLALGVVLLVRFLADLVPRAIGRDQQTPASRGASVPPAA